MDSVQSDPSTHPRELLSPIWSQLPWEILCLVVEQCNRRTLINWSCTNSFFHKISSRIIWHTLNVRVRNLNQLIQLKHALSGNHRGLTKPYAQRVKSFRFTIYEHGEGFTASIIRRYFASCKVDMLVQMPNLQKVSLEGPLRPETLHLLAQCKRLQKVSLRTKRAFLPYLKSDPFDDDQDTLPSPHTLSMLPLAHLTQLSKLKICRVTPKEAYGLARAIRDLPLTALAIAAAPPADHSDPRMSYADLYEDQSPI
ncbi:MAG: hypothetical protein L6R40_005402 [Gallowayella cf. fulva]|nr:MAG: hypothetical protein L6R40_005402 [Xanthomendoza cf. fulva]